MGEKIRELIVNNGLKFETVADNLGITRKTLHSRLSGETDFKVSEITGIIRLLRLTDEERQEIFLLMN